MPSISLGTLRNQCRVRSDLRTGGIWQDQDFNSAINTSIADLYRRQTQAWGENYFLSSSVFNLTQGQQLYTLPADHLNTVLVEWAYAPGMPYVTMLSFDWSDKNKYNSVNGLVPVNLYSSNIRWCHAGKNGAGLNQIYFAPPPMTNNQVQVWYTPQPVYLVNDTDVYDFLAGWEEYIILDVCVKALAAEESDTSVFERQRMSTLDSILDSIKVRSVNEPHGVIDVENMNNYGWWYP